MKANFRDSQGNYYHITGYIMKSTLSGIKYYDEENQELLGKCNKPLEALGFGVNVEADYIITTGVRIGYNKGARERDIKGIKEIATNHARSADGRHERIKNARRELKNK